MGGVSHSLPFGCCRPAKPDGWLRNRLPHLCQAQCTKKNCTNLCFSFTPVTPVTHYTGWREREGGRERGREGEGGRETICIMRERDNRDVNVLKMQMQLKMQKEMEILKKSKCKFLNANHWTLVSELHSNMVTQAKTLMYFQSSILNSSSRDTQ